MQSYVRPKEDNKGESPPAKKARMSSERKEAAKTAEAEAVGAV